LLYKAVLFLLLCLLPLQNTLHSSALETLQDSTIKVFHTVTRRLSTTLSAKMPLVVPGIQNTDGGNSEDWQSKLMGKKLGDDNNDFTFAKSDLPKEHRVIQPGSMSTADFKPDRVNLHVGDDGTVHKVTKG